MRRIDVLLVAWALAALLFVAGNLGWLSGAEVCGFAQVVGGVGALIVAIIIIAHTYAAAEEREERLEAERRKGGGAP